MKRDRVSAILTGDLRAHPAVDAWKAATSLETVPQSIQVLRERSGSAVYRLPGLGEGGTAVFAKRSSVVSTTIERTVYEKILPQLPLTAPRYYGTWVHDPYGWIFVEDVGDERYSRGEPEHLELAAEWVATLHVSAARLPAARSLPDAGPARYLEHIRLGRERILRSLQTWSFPRSEVGVLLAALSHCDAIEARWAWLEAACQGTPCTLVHGDFRPKNAYLKRDRPVLSLCPIDWETAGFGLPAADLTRIDLKKYWSVVRSAWPEVSYDTVARMASAGRVLEWLAAVDWASASLKCERMADRSDAVVELDVAVRRLGEVARLAGALA